MKVLVYGCGVIGSIIAVHLQDSGQDVFVLDKAPRLDQIRSNGLVIHDIYRKARRISKVKTVSSLNPEYEFDLVIVAVQKTEIAEILLDIKENGNAKLFLVLTNNPSGYRFWLDAIGSDRLLVGFPGAGGILRDHVVEYTIAPKLIQPTTLGEPSGAVSPRVREIAELIRRAGIPVATCNNMDAWQKYHVAWVSPLANAIRIAEGSGKNLADDPALVDHLLNAIRESMGCLRNLGYPVHPRMLVAFLWIPKSILRLALRHWFKSRHFDLIIVRHAEAAKQELALISKELLDVVKPSQQATDSLKYLHQAAIETH